MKKKILALIMILGLMISGVIISSNSFVKKVEASNSKSFFESLKSTNSLKKIDAASPNETVIGDNSSNLPNLLNSKNNDMLSSYGVDTKNVKSVKTVKDNRNARTISEVELDNKSTVGFDLDNKIISISNFKNNDQLKLQSSLPNKVGSDADLSNLINNIETNNNLKNDYKLVSSAAFDKEGDFWQLVWERKFDNGIFNPYDSIKVFVDRKDKSIVAYNKICMTPNTTQPVISENEALTSAQSVLDTIPNIKNKTVSLTTTRPNFYWNDNGSYEQLDSVRLAYQISVNDDSYIINIDAVTGENLGGSISKSVDAKAFAYTYIGYGQKCADLAHDGMANLGWNTQSSYVASDASLGSQISSWWNGSSSYAFYVASHGGPTTIGDNATWIRYTTDVSGNWYFVFLDACSTAVDTQWANAFKTTGYSNRGFLGWYASVKSIACYHFDQYFWTEVVNGAHSNNIKDAAIWSAAQVTEYTPIGYSGGRYYNGRAHS